MKTKMHWSHSHSPTFHQSPAALQRCNPAMLRQHVEYVMSPSIILKPDPQLKRHLSRMFGVQSCLWRTSAAPLWGVLKVSNCFNQLCAHSIPFVWHLVWSLDPRVSMLENVRRQVQVWEPPPGRVYVLLRKETKGPVAKSCKCCH